MSIELIGGVIYLAGAARLEDAERLTSLLQEVPGVVDLSRATTLHTAVVQALLALRPRLRGQPADTFDATWLLPLLREAAGVEQT